MGHIVAFVLKGYPRLSETFIAQEIRALECRGLDIRLISLRRSTDPHRHAIHAEIQAPVTYLPEYLYQELGRVLRAWRAVRRRPEYNRALACWLTDLRRDPTLNRIRRFGQALVMASEMAADVTWIYAHFLHTPASVARYAAMICDLPWSCSAHAKDIWTLPDWEKEEKLSDMRWLVTCTKTNAKHLASLTSAPERVQLVYHGLDFNRIPMRQNGYSSRVGDNAADPVMVVSVGRAVEKKGYHDLLDALGLLPRDRSWRLIHIGSGDQLKSLQAKASRLGIAGRIEWRGPLPYAQVLEAYDQADVFALASRIAANGDRDGLPNVLMEAQSQGVPCLSTRVSAVPELVSNEVTGLLVTPGDIDGLAASLDRLITDPELRQQLGEAGMKRVRADFACDRGIDILASRFGLMTPPADPCELPSTHR